MEALVNFEPLRVEPLADQLHEIQVEVEVAESDINRLLFALILKLQLVGHDVAEELHQVAGLGVGRQILEHLSDEEEH